MSWRKYHSGRQMITSALYGYEYARGRNHRDGAEQRAIIADRVNSVIAGIAASPLLREELIACGLSPELLAEGLKYHAEFLIDG